MACRQSTCSSKLFRENKNMIHDIDITFLPFHMSLTLPFAPANKYARNSQQKWRFSIRLNTASENSATHTLSRNRGGGRYIRLEGGGGGGGGGGE